VSQKTEKNKKKDGIHLRAYSKHTELTQLVPQQISAETVKGQSSTSMQD